MIRLSRPIEMLRPHYDVLVVGSGYGGGVAASRLARADRTVCVFERGKELHPGEFPDTPLESLEELQITSSDGHHHGSATGLYDLRLGDDVSVFLGCGLGGTSLVNANVGVQPDDTVFDDSWPTVLRGGREEELLKGYARAVAMLKPTPYPGTEPAKLAALRRSAESMGLVDGFRRAPIYVNFEGGTNHVGVEQGACNDCGDCMSGCNYGAKNTVLMNYLPDACNHGAEIFTEVRVHHVEQAGTGWRVFFEVLDRHETVFDAPLHSVTADIVVLAAGTLGSTEILLRSAPTLPLSTQLGERFSGNGGVLALGIGADAPVHSMGIGVPDPGQRDRVPPGPCITGMIHMVDPFGGEARIVEEGTACGPLADLPRFLARLAPDEPAATTGADALPRTQIYLSTTRDGAGGRLSLDEHDGIQVTWPGVGELDVYRRTNDVLRDAAHGIGATFVPNPEWYLEHRVVTVHPLGGCRMGDDAEHGVVNDRGQVFAGPSGTEVHAGLYVADGAIVPDAVAYNPSLTIAALAERIAYFLVTERGWKFDDVLPSHRDPDNAPQRAVPTLQFTERMRGHVSTEILDDFQRAANLGRAAGSPVELVVSVIGEDADRVLADPYRECQVRGSLRAPALSDQPMTITAGTLRVFVPDPNRAETRQMHYRFRAQTVDDRTYAVHAYKDLHDDPGFDLWADTTTLYVTIHDAADLTIPVALGIARMTVPDFVRELSTITVRNAPDPAVRHRLVARFGWEFFGSLFNEYGKFLVAGRSGQGDHQVRPERVLRAPAAVVHPIVAADRTGLRLTRYEGGARGPVVIAHAFGTSTRAFRTTTIETSLVEFLVDHQYDVWLFDYRASSALPASRTRFDLDDVARHDWPAAIAHVRDVTGAAGVQVIAHCVGSMTFLMAMLAGLRGVDSAVCSATTTHPVANELNRIKSRLGLTALLPWFGITDFDTSWHARTADRVFDRLLHLYPIPAGEHCGSAVCRRIFGIYGPSYCHSQLNELTHDTLADLFGVEHVMSFLHLTKIISRERVVDAHGRDVYLPHLDRLALPIRFIHGALNQEFLPEGTRTTYDLLRTTHDPSLYSYVEIPEYGHLDTFVGRNVDRDVFPSIVEHLDATA
jgi:cholesterol oxidase